MRLGLDVVETYEDKAISGKSDRRPSFQRLLRDAERGCFDCVLAWKSNRMGRNMLQAMTNEARLKDWGVRTFTRKKILTIPLPAVLRCAI